MNTKRVVAVLLMLLVLVSGVFAQSGTEKATDKAAKEEQIVLKFGAEESLEHKFYPAAQKFAEDVEKLTNGAVKIDLYYAGQLGNASELMEAIQLGAIDITCQASSISKLADKYEVFDLPFLFSEAESARKVLDGQIGKDMAKQFHEKGVMLLDYWELGFRYVTCNKKIEKPADFKGVKVRVPNNKMRIASFETVGASAAVTGLSELYLSLQQKVVDATELPLGTIDGYKYQEVQDYLILTKHVFTPGYLLISEEAWNKIPEKYHAAILEAAANSKKLVRELSDQEEASIIGKLESEGMEVVNIDSAAFQKAMNPVWDKYSSNFSEYLTRILAEIK